MILENINAVKQNIIDTINNNLCVSRIGKITKDNQDGTFDVSFVETKKYKNNLSKSPVVKCNVINKDINNIYNVGDSVMVVFADFVYKSYFKLDQELIIDKSEPLEQQQHSINNGIIIGKITQNYVIQFAGIQYDKTKIGIDKDTKKIIQQNENQNTKDILTNLIDNVKTLIDDIKTLYVIDPQSSAPLMLQNTSSLDSVKTSLDSVKTAINNLFL